MMRKLFFSISILISVITLVGVTNACSGPSASYSELVPKAESSKALDQPGDSVLVSEGMEKIFSLSDLINSSDNIVTGKVKQVKSAQKAKEGPLDIIYSDVIVDVTKHLYGNNDSKEIAIRVWGGRGDKESFIADWEPVFSIGDDTLLFLFLPPNGIQPVPVGFTKETYFKVTGSNQGKWLNQNGTVTNDVVGHQKYDISIIEQKIAIIHNKTNNQFK